MTKLKKRSTCYLCGYPFRPNAGKPHPLDRTKDHVIPKSRGGTNEASNIQFAHQCCNYVKGSSYLDGTIFEQCREVAIRNGAQGFSASGMPDRRPKHDKKYEPGDKVKSVAPVLGKYE